MTASDRESIPLYSVRNWNADYENSESRKLKSCRFVYTPNKHDGAGYGRMMSHPEGERLFAAWNAIIQVASKMPDRGTLNAGREIPGSSGKFSRDPLTAEDLSFRTRLKVETFRMALSFFSSREMGWLEVDMAIPIENKDFRENSGSSPDIPGNVGPEGKGTEGKGTEGKGTEQEAGDFPDQEGENMGKKKPVVQEQLIPPALMESPEFMEAWTGFLEMRKEIKKPATEYAQKLLLRKLEGMAAGNVATAIAILEQSVLSTWQDLYPLKSNGGQANGFQRNGRDHGGRPDLDYIPTGEN